MVATTPEVGGAVLGHEPDLCHRAASASLESTSWAHLRPGRFHAFDADTAVTVCAAVASVRLA